MMVVYGQCGNGRSGSDIVAVAQRGVIPCFCRGALYPLMRVKELNGGSGRTLFNIWGKASAELRWVQRQDSCRPQSLRG